MILIEDILWIHNASIERFGGGKGVRDMGLLHSAIARPFQTFGGEDLYPEVFSKAAALAESLIVNHPFVDGNKRTGFTAMVALLLDYGNRLNASQEEAYETIIGISTGAIDFKALKIWLEEHCSVNMASG